MISSRSLDRLHRRRAGGPTPARYEPWLAVVTCMDPRVLPDRALRVAPWETYVLRNAGGRVTDDVLRSLVIAWSERGVDEFAVIHHVDCALLHTTDEHIRAGVEEQLDVDASAIAFCTFDDLDGSVVADVSALRASPLIPDDIPISGFVFVESTVRLRTVVPDRRSLLEGALR